QIRNGQYLASAPASAPTPPPVATAAAPAASPPAPQPEPAPAVMVAAAPASGKAPHPQHRSLYPRPPHPTRPPHRMPWPHWIYSRSTPRRHGAAPLPPRSRSLLPKASICSLAPSAATSRPTSSPIV